MDYNKVREVNAPYLKAFEYTQAYLDGEEIKLGRWFKDPRMIKEWQPFYRVTAGEESTIFVLELDIRTDIPSEDEKEIIDVMLLNDKPVRGNKDTFIRELKLIAGLDFVRRFQEFYKDYNFFVKTSGQGYHIIQEYKGYINPKRFLGVARNLFHLTEGETFDHNWREKSRHFEKDFSCESKYGTIKYRMFIDKAGFRYGMISWVYSPYWKLYPKVFYSIPIKDHYTYADVMLFSEGKNVNVETYYLPEFSFEQYLLPEEEDFKGEDVLDKIKRRQQRMVQDSGMITIPQVGEELPYHFEIKLKEMITKLNSNWKVIAPAIRNAYEKICTESGHYSLRVLLVHALANIGYSPEDIALLFRFHINDERDNANPEAVLQQVLYYYGRDRDTPYPYTYACKTLQNPNSDYYCCDPTKVCGRNHCLQEPIDVDIIDHETDFEKIYSISEFILGDNTPNLIELSKTTRSGVTTSLVITSAEMNQKVVVLFPTRKICDDTYPEAIEIARQKNGGTVINGAVVRANTSACRKLIEKVDKYSGLANLHYVAKPPCMSDDNICKFWSQIYETPLILDDQIMPIGAMKSLDPTKCTLATIFQNPIQFDSIALTYAKMRTLLENNKLEIAHLKGYFDMADVIIMDEFSNFSADADKLLVRETRLGWVSDPNLPPRSQVYDFFAYLNNELFIIENLEQTEAIKEIINIVQTFITKFIRYRIPSYRTDEEGSGIKIVENPLSSRQRILLSQRNKIYHALIEKIAQQHNIALFNIERLLGFLQADEWLATNITSIFIPEQLIFIAKPRNTAFIEWIREKAHEEKKIITTDATLPKLSSSSIFSLDFKRVNAGDPMGNNDKQLIIADSRNISVMKLVINDELQEELINYINNVIDLHGTEKIRVVAPNKNATEMLEHYIKRGLLPEDLDMTYIRSNLTVGVKSDKRIMVVICPPFTPIGSHLADAYFQVDKFRDIEPYNTLPYNDRIVRLSNDLREHAMASAFYQVIGRAKDPKGLERSVVYCWGMRKDVIKMMFDRIAENTVVPTIYDSYVRFDRHFHAWVGKEWKGKGVIIPPIVGKVIDYIINNEFTHITTREIWKKLNIYTLYGIGYDQFHDIINLNIGLLEPFVWIEHKKTKSKKFTKKPNQNI
jgi:hypothetical protein